MRSAADALEVVALAVTRPPRAETIAFALDEAGVGATIVVVADTDRADALVDVVEVLAARAAAEGASALVVASVRPTPPAGVVADELVPGDIDRWLEASDVAEQHGLVLLEWFVVGPGGEVTCPRELFGEPPRWPWGRS